MKLITQLRANNTIVKNATVLRQNQVRMNASKPNAMPRRQAQVNITHERGLFSGINGLDSLNVFGS